MNLPESLIFFTLIRSVCECKFLPACPIAVRNCARVQDYQPVAAHRNPSTEQPPRAVGSAQLPPAWCLQLLRGSFLTNRSMSIELSQNENVTQQNGVFPKCYKAFMSSDFSEWNQHIHARIIREQVVFISRTYCILQDSQILFLAN